MWRPIDSAPRDGTDIKLFVSQDDFDAPPFQCVAAWSKRHRTWLIINDYEVESDGAEATHWAPLDPPPVAE